MAQRTAGRGLMVAGAIVMVIGLGVVAVRTFGIERHWIPVFVGAALFVAGLVVYLTSRQG
jgi:hypothetical protein